MIYDEAGETQKKESFLFELQSERKSERERKSQDKGGNK
jgi:hypothetical protein